MWSSLSLRQFAEVTILPDSPQQWNCEFSLEALTFLLCFDPSPLEACLPLRYPCPCHKKRKLRTYQGKELLFLAQQTRLSCILSAFHIWALSTNYFLVQEISGFEEICFPTFLSISVICLDIWMSVLPLGFLSCSSWFTTSPSDLVSVFWIRRIYLPTHLQLTRDPDVTVAYMLHHQPEPTCLDLSHSRMGTQMLTLLWTASSAFALQRSLLSPTPRLFFWKLTVPRLCSFK